MSYERGANAKNSVTGLAAGFVILGMWVLLMRLAYWWGGGMIEGAVWVGLWSIVSVAKRLRLAVANRGSGVRVPSDTLTTPGSHCVT